MERHVDDAVSLGAKILTGGKRHKLGKTYFEPTVLTEVTKDALVCQEETFGPVAPLIRYEFKLTKFILHYVFCST